MNRKHKYLAILAVLVVAALAFAASAFSRSASTSTTVKLKGVVGPGFTISLKKGGKKVKTLKAGKYKFVISDKSTFHDFTVEREHPSRPKLEKHITSTPFTGSKTFVMTLKRGSWRYYCSVHEDQMHHDFKVTR
jgi:plastocyanin